MRTLRLAGVQGTVRRFEGGTRSGDVLLDDGSVLTFAADAFDPSGLRLLRVGQRVRLGIDSDGAVEFITLATFDDPRIDDPSANDPSTNDPSTNDPSTNDRATS